MIGCLLIWSLILAAIAEPVSQALAQEATPSDGAAIGAVTAPVVESTVEPTVVPLEPTVIATESTEIPVPTIEPTAAPEELPTEISTPEPEATALPTATPTPRPVNTDTLLPIEVPVDVTLDAGGVQAFTFSYLVTTPRIGTSIAAMVRDASGGAAGLWQVRIVSHDGLGDGWSAASATSTIRDGLALDAGSTIQLVLEVRAPADHVEAELVTLHLTGTALLDDGSEEAGALDTGPLATITGIPAADLSTADSSRISPMSIGNGTGLTCTNTNVPHQVRPGESISFSCLPTVTLLATWTFVLTPATAGWTVSINGGGAGSTASISVLGIALQLPFTATLHAPANADLGAVGSASLTRTNGPAPRPTSTLQATVTNVSNTPPNGLDLGYSLTCFDADPVSQTVAPGGTLSFYCRITGLAGISIDALQLLGLVVDISSTPSTWGLSAGDDPTQHTGAIHLQVSSLVVADLLSTGSFAVVASIPCISTSGSVTVAASLQLAGLGLRTFTSSVPITVSGTPATNPPVATAMNAADFGTSQWTGSVYPSRTVSVSLTVAPPALGCSSSTWTVQVHGIDMTRTGDGGTIPIGAISYTGGTGTPGISPIAGSFALSGLDTTIANGTAAVTSTSIFSINLSLQPPGTAPPGVYEGTLIFTTANGQ